MQCICNYKDNWGREKTGVDDQSNLPQENMHTGNKINDNLLTIALNNYSRGTFQL